MAEQNTEQKYSYSFRFRRNIPHIKYKHDNHTKTNKSTPKNNKKVKVGYFFLRTILWNHAVLGCFVLVFFGGVFSVKTEFNPFFFWRWRAQHIDSDAAGPLQSFSCVSSMEMECVCADVCASLCLRVTASPLERRACLFTFLVMRDLQLSHTNTQFCSPAGKKRFDWSRTSSPRRAHS